MNKLKLEEGNITAYLKKAKHLIMKGLPESYGVFIAMKVNTTQTAIEFMKFDIFNAQ